MRLKLIAFLESLRIFATSSGLMITVLALVLFATVAGLDVEFEGRILRAFGTLADNSAHIDMVAISSGLFFIEKRTFCEKKHY